jgi:hypothetical protein
MASALLIDDNLKIDHFNVTTATGDFGIPHDGFSKNIWIDGSYVSGIDDNPMELTIPIQIVNSTDLAGNTYLKTAAPSVAPYRQFPARKFEYSDGRVTWMIPELPWSWMTGNKESYEKKNIIEDNMNVVIILIILVLILFIIKSFKI